MKYISKIFVIVLCLSSYAFAGVKSFLRINEKTRNVELAFKTYYNPQTDQIIKVISTYHIGDKAFYDTARESMRRATVLYESIGLTHEDIEEANKRIRDLGGSIATISSSPELSSLLLAPSWIYTYALALGLAHQTEALKYDSAAKLIHADKVSQEAKKDLEQLKEDKRREEMLRQALNEKIGYWSLTFPSVCKKAAEYALVCASMATWLSGAKEAFLKGQIQEVLDSKNFSQDFIERNQIVIDELKPLIESPKTNPIIAIVYGVKHSPFFAQYLKKNGFKLINTEWVVLTSLDQK